MAYLPITILKDIAVSVKALANYVARPVWLDPSTGRLNVNNITSLTTLTTVTTVSTVTSMTNMNGYSTSQTLLTSMERANWGANIRVNIT